MSPAAKKNWWIKTTYLYIYVSLYFPDWCMEAFICIGRGKVITYRSCKIQTAIDTSRMYEPPSF